MLLAVDAGTTNIKAGIFDECGNALAGAVRTNRQIQHRDGFTYYDPHQFLETAAELIREVIGGARNAQIQAVGITSMAETGLLVDRSTGQPQSFLIPWFDPSSLTQAEWIKSRIDEEQHFYKTGLRPSFKQGISKILWLKERDAQALKGSVWLSASAYLAFYLTGRFQEEYTLAARTFAFRIDERTWDAPFLQELGIDADLFPEAASSGTAVGQVQQPLAQELGLRADAKVFVAGHDHVCASLAVGAVSAGDVYNSMGTAETLVGTILARTLNEVDYQAGLSFGLHPIDGQMFWMGGHSTSGGSIEWLRHLLADKQLSYEQILKLSQQTDLSPGGILFYPYLSGGGLSLRNPISKAAFIGLTGKHGKADLLKAVFEGNAYQMETIRRRAEQVSGQSLRQMKTVGGGVHNPYWLRIKANVSGVEIQVPQLAEAALLGAALTAGVGSGAYSSFAEASAAVAKPMAASYPVDSGYHEIYQRIYERGFVKLQESLELFDEWISGTLHGQVE